MEAKNIYYVKYTRYDSKGVFHLEVFFSDRKDAVEYRDSVMTSESVEIAWVSEGVLW